MAAETAQHFEALEAQAQIVMSVFTKAGHEAVAPAVIQPADVFLDVIGENLRARTYVFTDPDGAELCLRPDLTVPTCRLHLSRHADPTTRAKYCYNGPAFRFQPDGADAAHPREFRQAGVERFGDAQREIAEAETIALILRAVEAAGLKSWSLQLGDLGLFRAVLDAANLPVRWRKRLGEAFLRPGAFRAELKALTEAPGSRAAKLPADLVADLRPGDLAASEAALAAYFDRNGIEVVGARSIPEMAAHLLDMIEDRDAAPLDAATAARIESYVSVSGPARTAGARVGTILNGVKGGSGLALDAFDRRLAHLANLGVELDRMTFSAEFGRTLAYYTGLVFEVSANGRDPLSPIAGGGRYDSLMRAAGAGVDVPAVGAAIHTERLLAAVAGGAR
ncbi:MAG: ATP phosphoribosyltransferase regulatory subunit [Hyphomicrobium sp.]